MYLGHSEPGHRSYRGRCDCQAAPGWVLQHKELVLSIIFGAFCWPQSPVFVLGGGVCFVLGAMKVKVSLPFGLVARVLLSRDK